MKTRVISALIGLAVALLAVWQFNNIIFNIFAVGVFAIALSEIYNAFKDGNFPHTILLLFLIGTVPLFAPYIEVNIIFLMTIFVLGFAMLVVFKFEKMNFKSIASSIAFGLYVLVGLYSITRLKIVLPFEIYGYDAAFLFVLMGAIAWGGDVMAYFSGYFFGKNKLSPKLSPKKTIEGAVGGVLGSVFFALLITFIYSYIKPLIETNGIVYEITLNKYLIISVFAAIGSCIGIVGDLFASAVKRQCNIKDYGSIMPGHGGVLDRFDSIILLAPFISSMGDILAGIGGIF